MTRNGQIKVTLIGDYLVFRNGLKMLLDSRRDVKVVSDVSDLSEARQSIALNRPDIIVVNENEVEAPEFESFLMDDAAGIPTLILANSNNKEHHQKYLMQGASGVVTKEQKSEVLFKAIEQVSTDELWFQRDVMKSTIERLRKAKNDSSKDLRVDKYASLTVREREVLTNICKGMKNRAIAEDLFITETTVRHHLTSIFEKLNVKSRLALAILAFNEGLVEIPSSTEKFSRPNP